MLPDNGTAYVTRVELNGTLRRIEGMVQETRDEQRETRKEIAEIKECIHTRVPVDAFNKHESDVWAAINGIRRLVYIAMGIGTALEVVVLPALMVILAVVIR